MLTSKQIFEFETNGYVVIPDLLNSVETDLLAKIARQDQSLQQLRTSRTDGEGGAVDLVVQNSLPEDSIYGAIIRDDRIVGAMEKLLGGEVYHYHHKMILKEAKSGGAWAWHQDYGYWYHNGCLFPWMASCMIAVDRATKANGCLQVLKGSHQIGRVDHGKVGQQTGADEERVEAALKVCDRVYVELEPGSAVMFHCNTLHRSDQNTSEDPRWAFICCYNAARNSPYKESKHPSYSLLEKWSRERIVGVGQKQLERLSSADH
ncbi:MAG: phytanoyl-CoA dioxygenase family protein [Planctomycetaceae bacterium]